MRAGVARIDHLNATGARRALTLVLAVVVVWLGHAPGSDAAPAASDKVALVIANGAYSAVPRLPNALSDGRLIARSLQQIGFGSVVVVEDADRARMEQALRDFSRAADAASVAVIYYAGHGVEINGSNYLIPVDARLQRDRDVEIEAVKLDTVLQMSEGARRLRVVILDACRNNPFLVTMQRSISTRAVAAGLAPIEPKTDSLVVYSAKAGATAADGAGANSPFARALSRRLVEPGREINLLFRQVRDDVLAETGGGQEPFTYGSLSHEEFYFVPGAPRAATADLEAEAWTLCRGGATRGPCDAYLRAYPAGRFASLSKTRIEDLAAPVRVPVAVSAEKAAVRVAGLGLTMQDGDANAVRVRSIEPNGPAEGELFVGDEILGVDAVKPAGAPAAARQMTEAVNARGHVQLLVKRGRSTALVVLRGP